MAHLVLVRSGYEDHLHKLSDLKSCLLRIQKEEADTVDRKKATEICESLVDKDIARVSVMFNSNRYVRTTTTIRVTILDMISSFGN